MTGDIERRTMLRLGGLAALGGLAGCSGGSDSGAGDGTDTATSADTATATPSPTTTASSDSGGGVPGNDVLGGPDALQGDAEVAATVLSEDQGAGTFVNTPAVVFVESGATVTWTIESGNHSVTAYHPDNDRPLRIPEGAASFDSGVLPAGESFEHTFETEGVYNYYCTPHEGLGMVGVVVVGGAEGGPGVSAPSELDVSAAASALSRLLATAGLGGGGTDGGYSWSDATWDAYWYSLYNMSTNIAMSGNGIMFPTNAEQRETFAQRQQAIARNADVDKPPIRSPNLNMAPFTGGDPHFTEKPVFDAGDGRPDATTLTWDPAESTKTVSPASLSWTHTKGVTWAKNFEAHFDILPPAIAPKFRAQVLTTMAQLGTKFALVDGNLRKNDENLLLAHGFSPGQGITDGASLATDHAATLWFLSDLVSLARGGWFGYVNPEPLVPAENLQALADGLFKTTANAFAPGSFLQGATTRDVGLMLGAVGWYGTHAGSEQLRSMAADYANGLASVVADNRTAAGKVRNGAPNQAATQGIVGQGLLWASQVEGVDHAGLAGDVLGFMVDSLWDDEAGTFASGEGASTYRITARDAGDITGGLNAAEAVLGMDVRDTFARFFNETFNRGRLQRAERPNSRDENAEYPLPLPPMAGGEFGQAAVYNAAVEYDAGADVWSVVDPSFHTADALYLANQDIWVGQWGGEFYQGRGVPGESDTPPS